MMCGLRLCRVRVVRERRGVPLRSSSTDTRRSGIPILPPLPSAPEAMLSQTRDVRCHPHDQVIHEGFEITAQRRAHTAKKRERRSQTERELWYPQHRPTSSSSTHTHTSTHMN